MAAEKQTAEIGLLVVEDDALQLRYVTETLSGIYSTVYSASDAEAGLKIVKEHPVHIVITDIYLPGMNGFELLDAIKKLGKAVEIILITAHSDVGQAVKAVKEGAYDYLPKPVEKEKLLLTVRRAVDKISLVSENVWLKTELKKAYGCKDIIGSSAGMKEVFEKIETVKDVISNVLIQGETGTGKEMVARCIHFSSNRSEGPFIKLNCGAIPKDLLESELFGHEKGSFTGAVNQRIGRFEMADKGSILLDEIGDMPLELQIKLLSVIQDRVIERIGGNKTIPVDVRIIAATHQDLIKAIKEKRFREDLYYRLNVINIMIPPLRDRKEDIPLLVEHFLEQFVSKTGKGIKGIDPQAMRILMMYDYPGNVRELENVIERAVVLSRGPMIEAGDLPETLSSETGRSRAIHIAPGTPLEDVEQLCILETLKMVDGNKRKAAELLKISEKSIYNKLQRYGIKVGADT